MQGGTARARASTTPCPQVARTSWSAPGSAVEARGSRPEGSSMTRTSIPWRPCSPERKDRPAAVRSIGGSVPWSGANAFADAARTASTRLGTSAAKRPAASATQRYAVLVPVRKTTASRAHAAPLRGCALTGGACRPAVGRRLRTPIRRRCSRGGVDGERRARPARSGPPGRGSVRSLRWHRAIPVVNPSARGLTRPPVRRSAGRASPGERASGRRAVGRIAVAGPTGARALPPPGPPRRTGLALPVLRRPRRPRPTRTRRPAPRYALGRSPLCTFADNLLADQLLLLPFVVADP